MGDRADPDPCDRRLEEVLAAYLEASDAGWAPEPRVFLARYPHLAPQLSAYFANQSRLAHLAAALSPPVSLDGRGAGSNGSDSPTATSRRGDTDPLGEAVSRFGDYDLLAEINHGGMGVVFQARQRSLDRVVALKMIRTGLFASAHEVERFMDEARSNAALDHKNIVPVYDVGEQQGQHFYTMKLVEGGDLRDHLPRLSKNHAAAVRLLATVARAVHYAHQRGILHRDLKPANILLDADGNPYVADFGLAKRMGGRPASPDLGETSFLAPEQVEVNEATVWQHPGEQGATQSGFAGSPHYMPPEQAAGKAGVSTTATDVYSLGAILYKILTGRPPLRGESLQQTIALIFREPPTRPRAINPGVSRDLEAICLKCLEKEPEKRYGSAQALAEDLERWLRGDPVLVRRRSWPALAWWAVRRHALVSTAMALVGFAIGGLSVFLYFNDPGRVLREYRRRLDAGETVALIGDTGPPRWSDWVRGADTARGSTSEEAPYAFNTISTGRLLLLSETRRPHYRYSAEIKHDYAVDNSGEVGVFFGSVEEGPARYGFGLWFADRGKNSQGIPLPGLPETDTATVSLVLWRETLAGGTYSGAQVPVREMSRRFRPQPGRAWRQLAVEMAPDHVECFWEGLSLGVLTREQAEGHWAKELWGEKGPLPGKLFAFTPTGSLGLHVNRGGASFRQVTVEPLP